MAPVVGSTAVYVYGKKLMFSQNWLDLPSKQSSLQIFFRESKDSGGENLPWYEKLEQVALREYCVTLKPIFWNLTRYVTENTCRHS